MGAQPLPFARIGRGGEAGKFDEARRAQAALEPGDDHRSILEHHWRHIHRPAFGRFRHLQMIAAFGDDRHLVAQRAQQRVRCGAGCDDDMVGVQRPAVGQLHLRLSIAGGKRANLRLLDPPACRQQSILQILRQPGRVGDAATALAANRGNDRMWEQGFEQGKLMRRRVAEARRAAIGRHPGLEPGLRTCLAFPDDEMPILDQAALARAQRVDPAPGRHCFFQHCLQRRASCRKARRARGVQQAQREGQPAADVAPGQSQCAAAPEQSPGEALHRCHRCERIDLLHRDMACIAPGCAAQRVFPFDQQC